MLSVLLWGLAAVLEGAAAWFLLMPAGSAWTALAAVMLHLAYAGVLSLAVYRALPFNYRQPRRWAFLYLFCTGIFIPVLSWFGLRFAVLPGLRGKGGFELEDWIAVRSPQLPYRAVELDPEAIYRRGGLATVLGHDDVQGRVRAIVATRYLQDRHAVPILRVALKDTVDEVRLLAYALLNSKESRIETAVAALRRRAGSSALNRTTGLAVIDEQLAALYLEEAELGVVEDAIRQFVLEQALERIDAALQQARNASREFLRGRICLQLKRLAEADAAFVACQQLGLAADKVAPYLAESAFEQGEYLRVREQFTTLGKQAREDPVLTPLVEYWT